MFLIAQIAFNNFIKQSRRNILLGIAIAFGVIILTMANSFSRGISDNLLNKIIVFVSGHMKVNVIEQSRYMTPIIRDRERILKVVKEVLPHSIAIYEDVGAFGRAVGNSKGDYIYLAGIDIDQNFKSQFSIVEGSYQNFEKPDQFPNPVMISETKQKYLSLKLGDQLRIRIENVNGQNQSGILTVAAIAKSQNIFMDYASFTKQKDLKKIMGYQPHETSALKFILPNPKSAVEYADTLHKALKPKKAYIYGKINNQKVVVLPIESDSKAKRKYNLIFETKYQGIKTYEIKALSKEKNIVKMNKKDFFRVYNYHLPKNQVPLDKLISLPKSDPFWQQIADEWLLLERTKTTKDFTKKIKDVIKEKRYQPIVDVTTMYETASEILKMEQIFNVVTTLAGAILFFIIMIGVLNSLRMTIRDRTREIGTIRALGMKKVSVRNLFMLEMLYLTITSWIVGILISFAVMKLLTLIQFGTDNAMNMLMVDRRLYFVTTPGNIIRNFIIVLFFVIITTYLPSRKAANLRPADALRHFE